MGQAICDTPFCMSDVDISYLLTNAEFQATDPCMGSKFLDGLQNFL